MEAPGWDRYAEQKRMQDPSLRPSAGGTLGTIDTFAISWFMTGKVVIAGSIAGLEVVTKVAWYYLHERVWAAVSWGRR